MIALVGAGSVGCMLGAHLAEAGHDVIVCGRTPLERIVMTIDGERIEYKVDWAAEPGELPDVSCAVLATKIQHTQDVAAWLATLPAGGAVIAAQNGVDHRDRIAPLTEADVVPTLVYRNAQRTAPGEVRVRRTGRGLVIPDDAAGRAVAALFEGSDLEVVTVTDFATAAWEKLLINVTANPLSALTGRTLELLREPDNAALALELALEAVAVAQAEGTALTVRHAEETIAWLQRLPDGTPSSMLQDRLAGLPLEHQGILAPVVALGRRHGVPTPRTSAVLAQLDALPTARIPS